jgi:hypothetical protein
MKLMSESATTNIKQLERGSGTQFPAVAHQHGRRYQYEKQSIVPRRSKFLSCPGKSREELHGSFLCRHVHAASRSRQLGR